MKVRRLNGCFFLDWCCFFLTDIHKSIIISEHGTNRNKDVVTKIFSTQMKILCIPVHG